MYRRLSNRAWNWLSLDLFKTLGFLFIPCSLQMLVIGISTQSNQLNKAFCALWLASSGVIGKYYRPSCSERDKFAHEKFNFRPFVCKLRVKQFVWFLCGINNYQPSCPWKWRILTHFDTLWGNNFELCRMLVAYEPSLWPSLLKSFLRLNNWSFPAQNRSKLGSVPQGVARIIIARRSWQN